MPLARPDGMLRRVDVQRILGCSRSLTFHLEQQGKLKAVIDRDGVHLFLRTDVLELARLRGRPHADKIAGTIAAEIFRLFREGTELPEIVMMTQQSPATVRALYNEFRRPLEPETSPIDLRDYEKRAAEDQKAITDLIRRNGTNGTNGRHG